MTVSAKKEIAALTLDEAVEVAVEMTGPEGTLDIDVADVVELLAEIYDVPVRRVRELATSKLGE